MDKGKPKIVLIVHNVRSAHNVGSILRSADGFGVERVYLTGHTPYPTALDDTRLPHISKRVGDMITKTALGAEKSVAWKHEDNISKLLSKLHTQKFQLVALEQTKQAINLVDYKPVGNIALIVGNEIGGIEGDLLKLADAHIQIPMRGTKESFNVSVATGVALYHLRLEV